MPLTGRCHCGRNVFEIEGGPPPALTRCTCSLCSKRGHLLAYYAPEAFRVVQADSDAVYRWNSKRVAHHFCSACGCDLYADSPVFQPGGAWDGVTRRIAVNARLLDDFEAADWPVTVIDGKHLW
ncbi:MAG: GFA family protein [Caulobacteraceae bacterium]|nr:GFA family protein [Caulobacteraceae bacterium]